jgi:hypothetical protein
MATPAIRNEIEALGSWVPVAATTHETSTADMIRASSPSIHNSSTDSGAASVDRYRTESPDGSSFLTSLGSSLADLSEVEPVQFRTRGKSDQHANRGMSDINETGQVLDGDCDPPDAPYVGKS